MLEEREGGLYRHRELASLLLERWATADGEAACQFAYEIRLPWSMANFVAVPLQAWAARDPDAAMEWLQANKTAQGVLANGQTVL